MFKQPATILNLLGALLILTLAMVIFAYIIVKASAAYFVG